MITKGNNNPIILTADGVDFSGATEFKAVLYCGTEPHKTWTEASATLANGSITLPFDTGETENLITGDGYLDVFWTVGGKKYHSWTYPGIMSQRDQEWLNGVEPDEDYIDADESVVLVCGGASGGGGATLPPFISTEYNFITISEGSAGPIWTAVNENGDELSFNELCDRAVSLPSYTPGVFEALQFIGSNSKRLEMFTPAKMETDGSVFKLTTTKLIITSDGAIDFQQVSGTLNS